MKQYKTCTFSRKSSFSSYVQHKNRKNKQSIQLVSVGWEAGGRKRARDSFDLDLLGLDIYADDIQ